MTPLLFLLFVSGTNLAQGSVDLFTTVPNQDSTYSKLSQMAKAGLLNKEEVGAPLTRYDVAQLLLKAQEKYDGIVLAQADMEIPPPPEEGAASSAAPASNQGAMSPAENPSAGPVTDADDDASLGKAAENLHSLQEVYQSELSRVKDRLKAVQDRAGEIDADQYALRKRIKGITQFPSISVHGLGRAYGYSSQYDYGSSGLSLTYPGVRTTYGFLDLGPEGTLSKEVSWKSLFRFQSNLSPNDNLGVAVRRVSMNFNPSWMSMTLGDFDEAYTPLMLWNRNSLDLAFAPWAWSRFDDQFKYESFLNHEPYLPLRGLRMGTTAAWPDSTVLQEFKTSLFAHMIRNGFNDVSGGGWYFGPDLFTDWAFGGTAGLKTQKMYLGGTSFQLNVDTYGVVLIDAMDTQPPGTPYGTYNPATWARDYVIGSVRPDLRIGLGGDLYVGGMMEYAFSNFQDDQTDSRRVTKDFALLGGPYVQAGDSRITFNYLNVGPYYYSPLAQTRQDNPDLSALPNYSFQFSPDLSMPFNRPQYLLSNVPRAGGIYAFFDRTRDNVFPYGLGTPNRQGGGVEIDLKALKDKALKFKGSAYLVQEISGNLVVNNSGTAYVPVDTPASTTIVPVRSFVYVNAGPSFNLGPLIGWDRALEIGGNARFEQTTSDLGTLTSTWFLGSVRVAVLPALEVSAAFSQRNVNGQEAGYNGSFFARYPYIFDNSDLGTYAPFNLTGSEQSLRFSGVVRVNRGSDIVVDYDVTTGNLWPYHSVAGMVTNQFVELTYEVKF